MPITYETPELQANESLKGFDSPDSLGKAYLDLHGKVTAGDVSLINEELRKDPSLQSFKNVNDIAKSYVETKKLVGSIKKAPETADGYKFTQLQNLHPGLKNVPETQKVLANIFHEAGIHNEAGDHVQQKILTLLSSSLQKQDEARKVKSQEIETALRSEWKESYDKNVDNIEKILARAGAPELAKSIRGNPAELKAIHRLTSMLSEDSIGKLGEGVNQEITESSAAQKRLGEMIKENNTNESPLLNTKHKDHEKTKAEWDRLHKVAYGEK